MNPTIATPSSAILPLVDALTLGGDRAPALLVQLEVGPPRPPWADWAAVAVKPSGILLVILDARLREPWDVVVARATGVLRTEQPEVLAGLAEGVMGVVLVGRTVDERELWDAPQVIPELGRAVHWIVVSPGRAPYSDGRPGFSAAATEAYKELDRAVATGLSRVAASSVRAALRADVERVGEAALAAEARFRGAMQTQKQYPPATTSILAACGVMFALEYAFGATSSGAGLARMGAVSGRLVAAGHYEALLSYAMLHGSPMHILMNGLALHSLGRTLENLIGGRRFLLVFTLSALGGGVATALLKPDQLVVGASGGIFGLMTALLGLTLRTGGELPTLARQRLRQGLVSTLLFNLGISLLPGVSLLGHAGGGAVGFVLGVSGIASSGVAMPWLPRSDPSRARRAGALFDVLAAISAIVLALSVVIAFARGRPWDVDPGRPARITIEGTRFSLEVPSSAARKHETLPGTTIHHTVMGDVDRDPMLVEIHAAPLGPEDVAELGTDEGLLAYFKARPKAMEVTDAQPQARSLDGARAVVIRGKTKNGSEYARWVFVDSGVLVDAEALLVAGAAGPWASAFSNVAPRLSDAR